MERVQHREFEHKLWWQGSILDATFMFLKYAFKIAAFSFPRLAAEQISDAPNVLKAGRGNIF